MKPFITILEIFFILLLISYTPNYFSGEPGEAIAFLALLGLFVFGMYNIKRCSRRKEQRFRPSSELRFREIHIIRHW